MMKCRDVSRNVFAAIIIGDETLVPHAGDIDDLQQNPIRAWQGVRFVNEGRDTAHPSSQKRGGGGEPAHPKDHLWFELAIEGPTERQAFTEAPNETENCRRKRRW